MAGLYPWWSRSTRCAGVCSAVPTGRGVREGKPHRESMEVFRAPGRRHLAYALATGVVAGALTSLAPRPLLGFGAARVGMDAARLQILAAMGLTILLAAAIAALGRSALPAAVAGLGAVVTG